jgi:PPOX class probable F420-dependent enzyme
MSRRDQIRMSDAEIEGFLDGRHTMNVATYNHDGTIHLVAMWYGFHEGLLAFETFSKSQKVRNLERDPRITVLVESGETYDQLMGVEVVGTASLYDDPAIVVPVAANIVRRYMAEVAPEQVDEVAQMMARKRTIVVVHPDRIVSWDHKKLGGGY